MCPNFEHKKALKLFQPPLYFSSVISVTFMKVFREIIEQPELAATRKVTAQTVFHLELSLSGPHNNFLLKQLDFLKVICSYKSKLKLHCSSLLY